VAVVVAAAASAVPVSSSAAPAKAGHASRRANARTGRLSPALAELVKASKRGDRAALGRVADRLGPARLGAAVASTEPGVWEAALAAAPLARGGVLLVGAIAAELKTPDPARAIAAVTALGSLLDGASPTELEDWDVPADEIAEACAALEAQPTRVGAPATLRLAAMDAIAAAAPTCGAPPDLAPIAHDAAPGVRRAATLLAATGDRRPAALRDGIADPDRGVSAAATAAACRVEARTAHGGKTEPPPPAAIATARALIAAPATPPEDAVEMLDCLAAAGTTADWGLVDQLQQRPPSPLRDRAVELAGVRARGNSKPQ
jgi:hypothetical protein